MPRPRKCRMIESGPIKRCYKPNGISMRELNQVVLKNDQLEAIRLADMEQMDQESAAVQMNISRPTFSRLVNESRKIVAEALVNGWALKIEGGDFEVKS